MAELHRNPARCSSGYLCPSPKGFGYASTYAWRFTQALGRLS
jgi:hypothetical protein